MLNKSTWKMAREIFEVLQKEVTSERRTVNEINIKVIQEVATDIGALVKYTSDIKGKTAKIQNLIEKYKLEIDEDSEQLILYTVNYTLLYICPNLSELI
jgi:hypothetical protein